MRKSNGLSEVETEAKIQHLRKQWKWWEPRLLSSLDTDVFRSIIMQNLSFVDSVHLVAVLPKCRMAWQA